MSVLQTERFYPNLTTRHPHLNTRHPHLNTLGRHLGTTALAAGCTTCAIGAGLAAAGTIAFLVNPLTAGPSWQLMFTAPLGTATWRLGKWTWLLARIIRSRA